VSGFWNPCELDGGHDTKALGAGQTISAPARNPRILRPTQASKSGFAPQLAGVRAGTTSRSRASFPRFAPDGRL